MTSLGIGFIGGGPATQAIHLPTLAAMPERFHVARVMDVDPGVANQVAARCGGVAATSVDEVMQDPAVEIVAICSPNQFHAEQVIAACQAGKRAVLCEKPLAVTREEAAGIARIAKLTNTPIIVGTMHAFDPAYRAARAAWLATGDSAHMVQSSIYLPGNDEFTAQASELLPMPPPPPRPVPDLRNPVVHAARLRMGILGLAIHDLPLVRDFYPRVGEVRFARALPALGYSMLMQDGPCCAELLAYFPGNWPPQWRFRAIGTHHELRVSFPPSYVLAGSARAELIGAGGTRVFESAINGYQALWHHVSDILDKTAAPHALIEQIVADLGFALDVADGAEQLLAG